MWPSRFFGIPPGRGRCEVAGHKWARFRTIDEKDRIEIIRRCRYCNKLQSTQIIKQQNGKRSFAGFKTYTLEAIPDVPEAKDGS